MTRRRWGLLTLAVAGVGWILGAEWVSIHHGVPENHFIDALSGLAFLAGGIIALDRRPGNAIGPLMIAFAFVSYVGNWGNIDVPVLPLLGASAASGRRRRSSPRSRCLIPPGGCRRHSTGSWSASSTCGPSPSAS
jgi:hypothetical protein